MPLQIESSAADAPGAQAPATNPNTTSDTGSAIGSVLGGVVNGLTGGLAGAASSLIGYGVQALTGNTPQDNVNRQIAAQQQLDQQQLAFNEQQANYNEQLQLDYWNQTNYPAQVAQLNAAGLNPALIYARGGGGTGGGTMPTPSTLNAPSAANSAQMQSAETSNMMMLEQMKVMDAQANLANAQAAKISGVDTQNAQTQGNLLKFQDAINQAVGVEPTASAQTKVLWQQGITYDKALADYNAWNAASFKNDKGEFMATDDPNNPLAKAYKAGLDNTIVGLQQAQTNLDIAGATDIIQHYKSNLAEQGIDPDSPWYANILGYVLSKAGITPKAIGDTLK